MAEYLLDNGAELNAKTPDGANALGAACFEGHLDVVKLLVDRGTNLNAAAHSNGMTPLMLASTKGHLAILQLLVKKGADFNLKDRNDTTALGHARENGHAKIIDYLSKRGVSD